MPSFQKGLAALVVAPVLLGACATKGYVRNQVAAEAAARDSAITVERNARTAEIAALRTDLESLRKDFGARIAQVEDGLRFAMPVTFAYNDANVRPEDQAALTRFATVAQKYYPGSTITIEGFADPAGSSRYNMQLSERRAESVKSFLTQQGLDGTLLKTFAMGEQRQVVSGAAKDDPGADRNRRVVFVIESAGALPGNVALVTPEG